MDLMMMIICSRGNVYARREKLYSRIEGLQTIVGRILVLEKWDETIFRYISITVSRRHLCYYNSRLRDISFTCRLT